MVILKIFMTSLPVLTIPHYCLYSHNIYTFICLKTTTKKIMNLGDYDDTSKIEIRGNLNHIGGRDMKVYIF